MAGQFKERICKVSGEVWKQYNSLQKCPCSLCKEERNNVKSGRLVTKIKKPIKKVTDKQKILNAKYSVLRIEFLGKPENKICPITKRGTTDVHHKMGRIGFADQWARENNIPLLIDTRFWVSLSREGHKYVEENPVWAKENGYSLSRLETNGCTEENK